MNSAIFLDRDGTIIEEKNYLSKIEDINFLENSFEGLKKLQSDFLLIIVTNQSGIARGYFTEEELIKINEKIVIELQKNGVSITEIFYCPHYKNGKILEYAIDCSCRKPKIGLVKKAIKKYNIDLSKSYVIGDKDSDLLLAKNCGCKGILIENNNYENKANFVFKAKDLLEASEYIIDSKKKGDKK